MGLLVPAVWRAHQVWYWQLKGRCLRPDGSRALVVDVGANFGWYSLFAAAMGCRVVAWEPVPHFRDFFRYGIALNNFSHLIQASTCQNAGHSSSGGRAARQGAR